MTAATTEILPFGLVVPNASGVRTVIETPDETVCFVEMEMSAEIWGMQRSTVDEPRDGLSA
jgi:hypothetical protein